MKISHHIYIYIYIYIHIERSVNQEILSTVALFKRTISTANTYKASPELTIEEV